MIRPAQYIADAAGFLRSLRHKKARVRPIMPPLVFPDTSCGKIYYSHDIFSWP